MMLAYNCPRIIDTVCVFHVQVQEIQHFLPCSKLVKYKPVFCAFQEQSESVLDAMFMKQVKKDEHVIEEGDDGDNFYVIETLVSLLILVTKQFLSFAWYF